MKIKLVTLLFATFLMAEDNNLQAIVNSSTEDFNTQFGMENSAESNNTLIDENTTKKENIVEIIEVIPDPNPQVYAALGNVVYDNVNNIKKLQFMSRYSDSIQLIQDYVADVNVTKNIGYEIEKKKKTSNKGEYLKQIRALSKRNDLFIRKVFASYRASMTYKDNDFFIEIVNSGLLDTKRFRSEIMSYYLEHNATMEATGIIKVYLEEDELLKKQEVLKRTVISKKEMQVAKIKRIQTKDKHQSAKVQEELESNLAEKKSKILDEQRRNLAN